ncbi:20582_t:CDS:2, partial [Entrophospora sp. SA101]
QHLRYKTEPRFTPTQNKELKFNCVLRFDDQKWSTRQEHMKKRNAKRDVAEQAMIYLQRKYPEQLRRTQRYMVEAFTPKYQPRLEKYGKGVQQMASGLHWTEMIPNVKKWYDEILKPNFPPCPRTLLHELVQKYNLGVVTYREIKNLPIHDEDPSVKFIVVDVGKRRFNPTSVFDKAQYRYAKDHVAMIAFEILYEEIEYEEKKLIDNMDLDYQRLIGNVIFMEDWKKITPHGSYKNITNYLGVPVEEEVPNDNSDDEVEKITYTTSKTLALLYPSMFSESGHNKTSKPPVTVTITKPTFERSQQRYKPYKPPVERSARPQQHYELHKPILHVDKTFISLIHELADKRHWRKPEYDYHRLADGGCYATLSVNNYMFTGGVYATRHSAKEDFGPETLDFSEDANVPILHQINVTSSTTCSHCNAFKFPPESPGMCCSNGKVILAEPNVTLLLQNIFSGSFYHRIGQLLPEPGSQPHYLQIYVWDTQHELHHQANVVPNSNLNSTILQSLKDMLDETNPYVTNFQYISNLPAENIGNQSMVICADIPGLNQRTHNAPTASQVAAIWINDDIPQNVAQKRDIVLYTQMDQLIHISELNGCYDPLAYPLLFPHGEQGWAPNQIPYRDILSVPEMMDIDENPNDENKHNMEHEHDNTGIQHRKFVSTMEYYAYQFQIWPNSTNLLLQAGWLFQHNLYQSLQDAVLHGDNNPQHIGQRILLPSVFIGSPRDMMQRYQDAMALMHIGRPDLFITMTCNPNWQGIQILLQPGQRAQDRPDITAWIFQEKFQELKKDIFECGVLGQVIAYIHVIEFQKWGLPHAHILVILHPEDKPQTPDDYDSIVCAEIPDPVVNPNVHATVVTNMFHGPCGELNPNSPCMVDDGTGHKRCSKGYPKQFRDETLQGEDFYPAYRRRQDDHYVKARACWVSASEAVWRILGFDMSGINPAVTHLQVHLPNQQRVIFNEDVNLVVVATSRIQQTSLTEYFKMNNQDPDARNLLYSDFPMYYTWNKATKSLKKRQHGGARSFEELKIVDGVTCATFKESAQWRGFLENDNEYQQCMTEAREFQMPSQLRYLFATLLVFGNVSDVHQLWTENLEAMAKDFAHNGIPEGELQVQAVLQNLNMFLQRHSKTVADYDLPELSPETNVLGLLKTLLEELSYHNLINQNKGGVLFVDGPAGSGKTYLYDGLLAYVQANNRIALAVASSGIASLLLHGGHTTHSCFK